MNKLEKIIYKLKLKWYRLKHRGKTINTMYPKLYKKGLINYLKFKYNSKKLNKYIRKKYALKNNKSILAKLDTINNYSKEETKIAAEGNRSVAVGIKDFTMPTGICNNPVSDELKEYIKQDKLGQLLNNPINSCIFYGKSNGYCFFGGNCKNKSTISEDKKNEYIKMIKDYINEKYGYKED